MIGTVQSLFYKVLKLFPIRGTCARRSAAGMSQVSGTAMTDSELPGRLPHESLPPYIGVPRGGAPWSIFSRDTRATIQLSYRWRE